MFSHKTTYVLAAFLLSGGLAGGCVATTAKKAPSLEPIPVPVFETTEPIAFKQVVLKVPRHKPIGSVGVGLACLGRSDFMPSGGRYSLDSERFNDVFREELEKANYEVVGDPDKLFGDPDINKAKYFIAGLINEIEVNACYPWAGYGNFSTSSASVYMKVEWQIYDTLRRGVVNEISTEGSSDIQQPVAGGSSIAIESAFAGAVRNLLAQQNFYKLVRQGEKDVPEPVEATNAPLTLASLTLDEGTGISAARLNKSVAVVRSSSGHGSGFMITKKLLMTNHHVVRGAGKVYLVFGDGQEIDGEVIARNSYRDVALVRLVGTEKPPLPLRTERPEVGADVVSYGAPLSEDYAGTLRKGIVSAYRIKRGLDYLQSDVRLNPGNSGGPLLDIDGNVVGVAVAGVMIGGHVPQGINFFIPIDRAVAAFDILLEQGASTGGDMSPAS